MYELKALFTTSPLYLPPHPYIHVYVYGRQSQVSVADTSE